jgi:hypothetical protein
MRGAGCTRGSGGLPKGGRDRRFLGIASGRRGGVKGGERSRLPGAESVGGKGGRWMDEWMDGRMDGWMDEWMDGRVGGWAGRGRGGLGTWMNRLEF